MYGIGDKQVKILSGQGQGSLSGVASLVTKEFHFVVTSDGSEPACGKENQAGSRVVYPGGVIALGAAVAPRTTTSVSQTCVVLKAVACAGSVRQGVVSVECVPQEEVEQGPQRGEGCLASNK